MHRAPQQIAALSASAPPVRERIVDELPAGMRVAMLSASMPLGGAGPVVQLLPAGSFSSRDGRPGPGKSWTLTDDMGHAIAADLAHIAAGAAFLFDYDHQTLRAAENGIEAPAAGWATAFEWRAGQGLYAIDVRWTEAAKARIDAQEYRYVSPVLTYDAAGNVTGVLMAAITNYPGLLGMQPLAAALQAVFDRHNSTQEPTPMNELLKKLLARLGLDANADEAAALSALDKLIEAQKAPATVQIPAALAYELGVKTDDVPAAVAALSARVRKAAEPHLQTIATLQGQLATLTATAHAEKVIGLIDKAIADGKLVPALRDWATDLGKADFAALQSMVDKAPSMPLINPQSGGREPGPAGVAALSADAGNVARAFGIPEADFAKSLAA